MRKLKIEDINSNLNDSFDKYVYINLDKVPILLDLSRNRTVDFKENKTIYILKSTKANSRITLLLMIDSEGGFAIPFIIS